MNPENIQNVNQPDEKTDPQIVESETSLNKPETGPFTLQSTTKKASQMTIVHIAIAAVFVGLSLLHDGIGVILLLLGPILFPVLVIIIAKKLKILTEKAIRIVLITYIAMGFAALLIPESTNAVLLIAILTAITFIFYFFQIHGLRKK